MSDFRLSEYLLKLGNHLKKNEKEDIIWTLVVLGILLYILGYQIR